MEKATCERIICHIDSILAHNSDLADFDIVYAAGDTNVSPVVLQEGNLGLASWCVKHVYSYAYQRLLQTVGTAWKYDECQSICRWSQFCLLIRPEVSTFWNVRRKTLQKNLVLPQRELQLTKLILSRKPKCMEAFYQRQWLYTKILDIALPDNRSYVSLEHDLCTWASGRHLNNYHAWNHRLWLLKKITSMSNCLPLMKSEFEQVKAWVQVHVSEHSGLHYMNKLIEFIICCSQKGIFELHEAPPYSRCPELIYENMLDWNKELIYQYPGHEALLCARRTLLLKWRESYNFSEEFPVDGPVENYTHLAKQLTNSKKNCVRSNPGVTPEEGHITIDSGGLLLKGSCTEAKKGKEVRRCDKYQSEDLPDLKRTCIENVSSAWCCLLGSEKRVGERWLAAAETDYSKALLRGYLDSLARMETVV